MAPSRIDIKGLGTTSSASQCCSVPIPSQTGHAPNGLLKEKSLGSISGIVNPEMGHAKRLENTVSVPSSAFSTVAKPSVNPMAVSRLSARRADASSRTINLSTTTSMSCLKFFLSNGASSMSNTSPSIFTR